MQYKHGAWFIWFSKSLLLLVNWWLALGTIKMVYLSTTWIYRQESPPVKFDHFQSQSCSFCCEKKTTMHFTQMKKKSLNKTFALQQKLYMTFAPSLSCRTHSVCLWSQQCQGSPASRNALGCQEACISPCVENKSSSSSSAPPPRDQNFCSTREKIEVNTGEINLSFKKWDFIAKNISTQISYESDNPSTVLII